VLAGTLVAVELVLLATPPWFDLLNRRAVLASRRPRHPVGWLLLAMGLVMSVSGAAVGYIP
jgi:hypothetical protein